jgi:lipopolysaccharide transport system permease protein
MVRRAPVSGPRKHGILVALPVDVRIFGLLQLNMVKTSTGASGFLTEPLLSPWRHRQIVSAFTIREIIGRYRGSIGGLLWTIVHPLLMLGVYTFVFAVVFKARWPSQAADGAGSFAVVLFAGLIVHGFFSECLQRSPRLVVEHANLVKKLVFPVEILPVVVIGVALFHAAIGALVLLAAMVVSGTALPLTALLTPVVLAPLMLLTFGVSLAAAAVGVYIRDLAQITGLVSTAMLFLSPVFYPVIALPEALRPVVMLNPLSLPIEQFRDVAIWGRMPDWGAFTVYTAVAICVLVMGHRLFLKCRRGFADVL